MIRLQKQVCMLTAACTVILSLAGCTSSSKKADVSTNPSTTASTSTESTFSSDKPITLTNFVHWNNKYIMDQSTMPILQKAAKLTNVSLENTASAMETNSKQAFNLMIASKNLPDIIGGTKDDINKYGMQGALKPLNELIEKNAPNFKAYLDKNPDVKYAITSPDGKIYHMPFVYDTEISEGWFIRQDWLNTLGLKAPTTKDELYKVLTAFRNNDPNKNGAKDEVALFSRTTYDNKLLSMLSIFGISDYWAINDKTGKVQIGTYTNEYKNAMKELSKWYSEGLIDSQVLTRDVKKVRDELFPQNNGGLVHDWFPSTSSYNDKMVGSVPGFELKAILPVADSNGDVWEIASRDKLNGMGWSISSTNKYPVETIKYFDFWWSEQGRRLMVFGIEGEDYDMVNGKPIYKESVVKGKLPINEYIRTRGGIQETVSFLADSTYEYQMMSQAGMDGIELYRKSNVLGKKNVKIPVFSFTKEENAVITSKWPVCRSYILETEAVWLTGGASKIDEGFDKYMTNLKNMGMDEVVNAYDAAYKRYQTSFKK